MGPVHPRFEVGDRPVRAGQELLAWRGARLRPPTVLEAGAPEAAEPLPAIVLPWATFPLAELPTIARPICELRFRPSPTTVVLLHSGSDRVVEATSFSIELILSL